MKVFVTLINILGLLWAATSIFTGLPAGLVMAVAYGMSLGSIYGSQKKSFNIIAVVLNVIYIFLGLFALIFILSGQGYYVDQTAKITIASICFFCLFAGPLCNILLIKPKLKQG